MDELGQIGTFQIKWRVGFQRVCVFQQSPSGEAGIAFVSTTRYFGDTNLKGKILSTWEFPRSPTGQSAILHLEEYLECNRPSQGKASVARGGWS